MEMKLFTRPTKIAEHAIHFWSDPENAIIERNTVINCDRGIGLGLGNRGYSGGVVRNNVIYSNNSGLNNDVGLVLRAPAM